MTGYRAEESRNAKSVSDAELVLAARRGDKRAFIEIVARHQAMVCGIALGILGDFAASEDAGQEAFLTAWRKIHELREPERLRAWLAQIVRNAARGQLRSARPLEPLADDLSLIDEAPTPAEAAATEEEAELVRQSLARLPESYRLPLVLYYREGQSVRAVAEALGISEDAAKQRLARGREMCRDQMASLIETVLTRTKPSTIFTMAVAVAIGALVAPSAMAGAAFAASTAASTASTGSSIKTFFATVMTSSKTFILTTAMVALVFVPIGYNMHIAPNLPAPKTVRQEGSAPVVASSTQLNPDDSALIAEWRSLHQKYGTNVAAMPVLYKAIHDLQDAFHRRALTSALISEWAQVDPAGGLAFFMTKGHSYADQEQFFREWLAKDPQGAVAALMQSGSGWQEIARSCLNDIAHSAPNQVPSIAAQLPKAENYWDSTVRDAFAVVAEKGIEAARTAAEGLSGPNRDQALAGVASVWARTDLAGVIAWAKALPDDTDKDEIIRMALVGKASVDPVAALASIGVVPEGGRQAYFASTTGARVLSQAAETDFDATVAWLNAHPGRLSNQDLEGLAGAVTQRLNAEPADFLGAQAANGSLKALLPAISSALLNGSAGQRAPIWAWLKSQPPSPDITAIQNEVLSSAAWEDPNFAMQLVSDLPNTSEGDQQVQNLAQRLFNGGSMLSRFDQLMSAAPSRLKTPLAEQAFDLLRNDDLSNPQLWATRLSLLPASAQTQGATSLARAWAAQAPADAVTWANSLPQDMQTAVVAAIAAGWAEKDPSGVATWLNTLPAGAERDKSTASLVSSIAQQHPAEAWNWALSISDPSVRKNAASSVIQWMAASDPATAKQWIDSGSFAPEMRSSLQALLQKQPAQH